MKSSLSFRVAVLSFILLSVPQFAAAGKIPKEELASLEQFFLKGEYARVAEKRAYLDKELKDTGTLTALYYVGVSLIKLEQPAEARTVLENILERKPNFSKKDLVLTRIADTYFLENKLDEALEGYEGVIDAFPDSIEQPYAYEQAAKVCQKLGRFEEAHEYFKELQSAYPLSFEATNVRRRRTDVSTSYAVQVGMFTDAINAEKVKSELEGRGFTPYVSSIREANGTLFYRVRLGNFTDRSEAESLAHEVENFGYLAQVVP